MRSAVGRAEARTDDGRASTEIALPTNTPCGFVARMFETGGTPVTSTLNFGPYRLEPDGPRLWKGDALVPLQPRPLAVLCYLAARPGEVVGRDELIRTLWAGTYVTRAVLKVAVRAIREALGDDAEAPRYIETVGREGYRFVAAGAARPFSEPRASAGTIVGRDAEIALLRAAFVEARAGMRRVVFVTGEGGIGKTTLVERFLAAVEQGGAASVARGQCLEQYGGGEAYLPVLEAVGRLARDDASGEVDRVLRRHAPTWIAQLPALDEAHATPPGTASPARMLREMADALEVLTRDRPLVLVLEDLHWSDVSTIDLIAYVARRRQPARLLLIGTFRPADALVSDHPLWKAKQDLLSQRQCAELAVPPLTLADVQAYVDGRFAGAARDQMRRLATSLHERTDGNALFVVDVVNDLVAQETLVWRDGRWQVQGSIAQATSRVPAGVRELIGDRLQRLTPAMRTALEVASVVGDEFDVATVATALERDAAAIDELFETLAAQGMLIDDAGIAAARDGVVAGRYRFLHALYRHVLYEGIGAARRARLHRTIGRHEEAALGDAAAGRAAELAVHFERAHDHERALHYHELAGAKALERHAAQEAAGHFASALAALTHQPRGTDRTERELGLVLSRATLLMATRGYGAPETEEAFARARTLCDQLPASPKVNVVLRGLLSYHCVRAELAEAFTLGELFLRRSASAPDDRALRVQAHYSHGVVLFHMGRFDEARRFLETALADYDVADHAEHLRVYGGYDPGVACSMWLGMALALVGRIDDGSRCGREGFELARRLGDPFSLAWAHYAACVERQLFGEWAASEPHALEAVRIADEHGFPHTLAIARTSLGWAMVMQGNTAEGIPLVRDGVAAVEATGCALVRPQYLTMLAAADAIEGDLASAAALVDEALAEMERTGEVWHEVHLRIAESRFRGDGEAAEASLRRAFDVAHAQGARLLELRAAVALGRYWRDHGRAAEARTLVEQSHAWFAATGPVTPEIRSARKFLAELVPTAAARDAAPAATAAAAPATAAAPAAGAATAPRRPRRKR